METMTQDTWAAIDSYYNGLFLPQDEALEAALEASKAAGLPSIQLSPSQGKLLQTLARVQRAKTILEVGTLGGYSTIWLARALPAGGKLVTLEYEQKHAEVARGNIASAGFAGLVEIKLGAAADTLPTLIGDSRVPFDFIFIDADKPGYADYFRWSMKLSRPGTLIVADNVVRKGEVANAATTDKDAQGIRRFNQAVAEEPRVTATAVQTVGTKGHDGMALILVNS
jgi:predicted O-methyltransferase YrrM